MTPDDQHLFTRLLDKDVFKEDRPPVTLDNMEAHIMEALGRATMCFEPLPAGRFIAERCMQIGQELAMDIRFMVMEQIQSNK